MIIHDRNNILLWIAHDLGQILGDQFGILGGEVGGGSFCRYCSMPMTMA